MLARFALRNNALKAFPRLYSQGTQSSSSNQGSSVPQSSSKAPEVNANVPGLSEAVIAPASQSVGPGVDPSKSGPYKAPEYFCYNDMSYFEAEVEMAKYRLPAPSALKQS